MQKAACARAGAAVASKVLVNTCNEMPVMPCFMVMMKLKCSSIYLERLKCVERSKIFNNALFIFCRQFFLKGSIELTMIRRRNQNGVPGGWYKEVTV